MQQNIFNINVTIPEKIVTNKDTRKLFLLVESTVMDAVKGANFRYLFKEKYELNKKEEDYNNMKEQLRLFVNFTN